MALKYGELCDYCFNNERCRLRDYDTCMHKDFDHAKREIEDHLDDQLAYVTNLEEVLEAKRDLKADLELCNRATPGPWYWSKGDPIVVGTGGESLIIWIQGRPEPKADDITFLCAAREGWPYAIERALEAKADLKQQEDYSDMVEDERNKLYCLAKELAEALEIAFELLEDHQPNWYLIAHFNQINIALGRAKEVLGDE